MSGYIWNGTIDYLHVVPVDFLLTNVIKIKRLEVIRYYPLYRGIEEWVRKLLLPALFEMAKFIYECVIEFLKKTVSLTEFK